MTNIQSGYGYTNPAADDYTAARQNDEKTKKWSGRMLWRAEDGGGIPVRDASDTSPALVNIAHDGPSNYLVHMTGTEKFSGGALFALGPDQAAAGGPTYGHGILMSIKRGSKGFFGVNESTITVSTARAFYGQQNSTVAALAWFEQKVAGAQPAMVWEALQANAGQKLVQFRSNTGSGTSEEAGVIRADNGWLDWKKPIKAGGYTTTGRPTGLGASVAGLQIFDTTLGRPIWWNGSAWIDAAGTVV